MAIVNGYATLAELKARMAIATATSTHDGVLEAVIEAASRRIDNDTNRRFYSTASETRFYTPDDSLTLFLTDDVLSLTLVRTLTASSGGQRTYGDVWNATDWDLEPYDGPPYSRLVVNPTGLYAFPRVRRAAELTGTFGYCTTGSHPSPIREACLLLAARAFERSKAPLGVISGGELSQSISITKSDPDVNALLAPYRKFDAVTHSWW